MNLLDLDARWKRFNDPDRACPCCGKHFSGVFDIGFEEPQDWPHGPRTSEDMAMGDDRLTPDLCRLMGRYFLRATLPLPLRGADETFHFGLWVEVDRATLHAYIDTMEEGAPFSGYGLTANDLPGFDGDAMPVRLTSTGPERPTASAIQGPLEQAQTEGLSFDDLLDIYAASGQDIRPHLTT
ncbi:DUF2199 domain-containing protein [Sagittula salina]|uniref:DUF2199 domain-containing protein n=1 Tax=Sagittula salina TaxID=2820268 RepID=A0A940MM31_9RHOB|nr:DUF2199 domain-containing protein [Sagittula salina]MBP0480953.1 DUF2199 domain-containing protein [Sagittula salina]